MPQVSGGVAITVNGKTADTKTNPIEVVQQAVDANGQLAGYYHTFAPVTTGGGGVRLDPANGGIQQYSHIDPDTHQTVTPNIILSLYNATPPGLLVRGNTSVWTWPTPGSVWPNVGYLPTIIHTSYGDRQGSETISAGDSGGFTSETISTTNDQGPNSGGLSPNDWGRQDQLPLTVLTKTTDLVNPGAANYYMVATDLYPVPVRINSYQNFYFQGQYNVDYARVYLAPGSGGFGSDESYVVDAQKFWLGTLFVRFRVPVSSLFPKGVYVGPNRFLGWDGRIEATSQKLVAEGEAHPSIDDPVTDSAHFYADGVFGTASYNDGALGFAKRQLYRNSGVPSTSGLQPVPPRIKAADVGSATIDLKPKVAVDLYYQSGLVQQNHALEQVPGSCDLGVMFVDGSYYSLCSGTATAGVDPYYGLPNNLVPEKIVDYWMGFGGPDMTRPVRLRARITLPDTTFPDGTHCPAMSVDSDAPPPGVTVTIKITRVIDNGADSENGWAYHKAPTTIYTVTVTGAGLDSASTSSAAQMICDVSHSPEIVEQNAPQDGVSPSAIYHSFSLDAGTTFTRYPVPAMVGLTSKDGAVSPSLLINPKTNQHRILYAVADKFYGVEADRPQKAADWSAPKVIALTGYRLPCVVAHPQKGWDSLLMAAVRAEDAVTIDVLESLDQGVSWQVVGSGAGSITKGIGRASVWIDNDESVYLAYTNASGVVVSRSTDTGKTFLPPVLVLPAAHTGSVHGPSLTSFAGSLYLVGFNNADVLYAPYMGIYRSSDLGLTWTKSTFVAVAVSAAMTVHPLSGRIWLNNLFHSDDQAKTFTH